MRCRSDVLVHWTKRRSGRVARSPGEDERPQDGATRGRRSKHGGPPKLASALAQWVDAVLGRQQKLSLPWIVRSDELEYWLKYVFTNCYLCANHQ